MSSLEKGFTLIELLIAIVVMSVVMTAGTTAFLVGINVTNQATTTFMVSQASAFTSAQFSKDVQSATSVQTATAGCAGSGTLVLALAWTLPTQAVDYRYRVVDGQGELQRVQCGARSDTETVAQALVAQPVADASSPPVVSVTLRGRDGSTTTISAVRRIR